MERVARVLCMCVEFLVPFGAVVMVSRMLVYYVDGVFLMFRWVGAVCGMVDVRCLFKTCHKIVLIFCIFF